MSFYLIMAASFFIFGSFSAWRKGHIRSAATPVFILSMFWPIIIICAMTAGMEDLFGGDN